MTDIAERRDLKPIIAGAVSSCSALFLLIFIGRYVRLKFIRQRGEDLREKVRCFTFPEEKQQLSATRTFVKQYEIQGLYGNLKKNT